MDGNSSIVKGTAFETIQVAKDWQKHRKMSIPVGGYLGKGFTKYAFQVSSQGGHILIERI